MLHSQPAWLSRLQHAPQSMAVERQDSGAELRVVEVHNEKEMMFPNNCCQVLKGWVSFYLQFEILTHAVSSFGHRCGPGLANFVRRTKSQFVQMQFFFGFSCPFFSDPPTLSEARWWLRTCITKSVRCSIWVAATRIVYNRNYHQFCFLTLVNLHPPHHV